MKMSSRIKEKIKIYKLLIENHKIEKEELVKRLKYLNKFRSLDDYKESVNLLLEKFTQELNQLNTEIKMYKETLKEVETI